MLLFISMGIIVGRCCCLSYGYYLPVVDAVVYRMGIIARPRCCCLSVWVLTLDAVVGMGIIVVVDAVFIAMGIIVVVDAVVYR